MMASVIANLMIMKTNICQGKTTQINLIITSIIRIIAPSVDTNFGSAKIRMILPTNKVQMNREVFLFLLLLYLSQPTARNVRDCGRNTPDSMFRSS